MHLDLNFPSLLERRWGNFLQAALLVSNERPSEPAITRFKSFAARHVPDGSMQCVQGVDAAQILRDWRGKLLPVSASVRGQKESPGFANDPANIIGRCCPRKEIGGHAALLRLPGFARVCGAFDFPGRADTPAMFIIWSCDEVALQKRQGGNLAS